MKEPRKVRHDNFYGTTVLWVILTKLQKIYLIEKIFKYGTSGKNMCKLRECVTRENILFLTLSKNETCTDIS